MILGLDHVQLAIPPGGEDAARDFWVGVLGFCELEKPAALRVRGGAWFEAGGVQVHVGVEDPFQPAKKAHPAFRVGRLEAVEEALRAAGASVRVGEDLPGVRRLFTEDPFGNRVELLERAE